MSAEDREMAQRRAQRLQRMVVNRARSFEEAAAWDLAYWQARTPQERIEALEELRAARGRFGHAADR